VAEGEVQIDGLEGHQVIDTEGIVAWREGGGEGGGRGGGRGGPGRGGGGRGKKGGEGGGGGGGRE